MEHLPDSFTLDPAIQAQVDRLIASLGEFGHLERARLPVILSQRALVERGRAVPVAVLHGATYEGLNSATRNLNAFLRAAWCAPVCGWLDPDFLIVVDVAQWPADPIGREQLLYHALCHIEQRQDSYGAPKWHDDGRPMLRLRAHDIERFTSELARYGHILEGFDVEANTYTLARERTRRLTRAG